jgi:hypothetical protein
LNRGKAEAEQNGDGKEHQRTRNGELERGAIGKSAPKKIKGNKNQAIHCRLRVSSQYAKANHEGQPERITRGSQLHPSALPVSDAVCRRAARRFPHPLIQLLRPPQPRSQPRHRRRHAEETRARDQEAIHFKGQRADHCRQHRQLHCPQIAIHEQPGEDHMQDRRVAHCIFGGEQQVQKVQRIKRASLKVGRQRCAIPHE